MRKSKTILSLAAIGLTLLPASGIVSATEISHHLQNSATLAQVEAMLDNQSERTDSSEAAAAQGSGNFENSALHGRGNGRRGSSGHRGNRKPQPLPESAPAAGKPAEPASRVAPVERVALVQKKEEEEEKFSLFNTMMGPAFTLLDNDNIFVTLLGAFVGFATLPFAVAGALGQSIYDLF